MCRSATIVALLSFLEVLAPSGRGTTDQTGDSTLSQTTDKNNQADAPDFTQVGWSTQNGGTTGGNTSLVVCVSTVAELQAAASSTTSQTIRIIAPLTSSSGAKVTLSSNKTILGEGTRGVLQGIGFSIQSGTSNIIIRNLKMSLANLTPASDGTIHLNGGDLIQIYGRTAPIRNIWIDHCEFYSEVPLLPIAKQASDKYDGLIDPTWDVAFVTISWCYFHDHYKTCLVGGSDTDNFDRRITFHHNRWENVIERTPSYRYGHGHVYNSYFKGIVSSGVHIRKGATLRVEGSVFENSDDPIKTSDSGSSVLVGTGHLANVYVACTGSQPTVSTPGVSLTIPYPYTANATSTVKATVLTWAGFGKITP
jgi:pectate lyase